MLKKIFKVLLIILVIFNIWNIKIIGQGYNYDIIKKYQDKNLYHVDVKVNDNYESFTITVNYRNKSNVIIHYEDKTLINLKKDYTYRFTFNIPENKDIDTIQVITPTPRIKSGSIQQEWIVPEEEKPKKWLIVIPISVILGITFLIIYDIKRKKTKRKGV